MTRSKQQQSAQKLSTRQQERASLQAGLLSVPPNRAAEALLQRKRYRESTSPSADRGVVPCAWCRASVKVAKRDRVPKWCSPTCRPCVGAAPSRRVGFAAIAFVERPVEVVRTVAKVERVVVDVPRPASPTSTRKWAAQLEDQLDRGRIHDRDGAALI